MVGILEYTRYERQIQRELIRRIGYTNGLHEIHRFARVVEYLYPIIPSTQTFFRSIIIEEEKKRNPQSKISNEKYLQGIIEVASALALINKTGEKIFLTDRGYALHALKQINLSNKCESAFLLMSVLDADGEYLLNLLDILNKDVNDSSDIGKQLLDIRIMKLFEIKLEWAKNNINPTLARFIVKDLETAQKKFSESLNSEIDKKTKSRSLTEDSKLSPKERVERFREHTIIPRLGWLNDLGCIKKEMNGKYIVTESGKRLLTFFNDNNCVQREVFILPPSSWISMILGEKKSDGPKNLFWEAVAMTFSTSSRVYQFDETELWNTIKMIYPHTKLFGFNQSEILSIYHAISCIAAVEGVFIKGGEEEFNENIKQIVKNQPDKIALLSKKIGSIGYIAMKEII